MALSERRVTHLSPDAAAVLAFAKCKPGADRRVLERVAEAVILGQEISVDLQKIANALLANALFTGKLPAKATGRPKEEFLALRGVERAYRYFELLDGNKKGAAKKVTEKLPVGDRQVEREARKYRWLIGLSPEDRDRFRIWRSAVSNDEYEADVLISLRQREGRPAVGGPPVDRMAVATDLVAALRKELIDSMNLGQVCAPT